MSLGKSDPPPAPDYAGAARAQGGANLQSTIASYILSNPTQVTPYGTMSQRQTGTYQVPAAEGNAAVDIPTFTSQIDFTPEGQQRWAQEQRIIGNLGNVAEAGVNRVGESMAKPFSFGSADELQNKTEQALLARLNPQMQQQEDALRARLMNQGIPVGSEAFNAEIGAFGRQRNDAMQQAVLGAMQARPQAIQEEAFLRNQPLNELNALRSGSQVTNPTFQAPQGMTVAPAPVFGAAQAAGQYGTDVYNAQAAQQGATIGALGQLGGAAILGGMGGNPFSLGGKQAPASWMNNYALGQW